MNWVHCPFRLPAGATMIDVMSSILIAMLALPFVAAMGCHSQTLPVRGWIGWRPCWLCALAPPILCLPFLLASLMAPNHSSVAGDSHGWAWIIYICVSAGGVVVAVAAGLGASVGNRRTQADATPRQRLRNATLGSVFAVLLVYLVPVGMVLLER